MGWKNKDFTRNGRYEFQKNLICNVFSKGIDKAYIHLFLV